jgi:transposase IS481 family protein
MKLHGNARLSPKGRLLLCRRVLDDGWSLAAAAEAVGVGERTAGKWPAIAPRARPGCWTAPRRPSWSPTTDERRIEVIAALRRLEMTGAEIADCLGMALSTVSGILTWIGMGKLGRLGLERACAMSERGRGSWSTSTSRSSDASRPRATGSAASRSGRPRVITGATTKAGSSSTSRSTTATRLTYVEVLDDAKAVTAAGFLRRAVNHFASYGITVERLITDNGNPYRSTVHAIACHALGIRWPAGSTSTIADDRTGALSHKPPIAPLNELNNFLGPYI